MNWRPKLIINDLHLGVQRSGGTTPASAAKLRADLLGRVEILIMEHTDKDLVINGDLFDTFTVPLYDVLQFYHLAVRWLRASVQGDGMRYKDSLQPQLILGEGNHDWSKDSSKLSSFALVAQLLQSRYPGRVRVVNTPQEIDVGIYMVPHMPNQDLFDHELAQGGASKREHGLILFHANFDNNFAAQSDHSLNVSREQAAKLIAKDNCLLFGHEHQKRWAMDKQVLMTGNQFPTSIADCLNNPDDMKCAHVLELGDDNDIVVNSVVTWKAAGSFGEIDWSMLHLGLRGAETGVIEEFIRIVGTATATQAADVIAAIAKLRAASTAYVVGNAVKIEGVNDMEELSLSVEEVQKFDVLGYLLEQLDPAQADAVRDLLAKAEPVKEAA